MNINKYLNHRGTVLSDDPNKDLTPENTFIWTLTLYKLAQIAKNMEVMERLAGSMDKYFYECIGKDGYFKNIALPDNQISEADKFCSKDQLIGYMCYSFHKGTDHYKTISDQIKFFKYNGNFIHPKEVAAIRMVAGSENPLWESIYVLTNVHTFKTEFKTRPTLEKSIKIWLTSGFNWPNRSSTEKTDGEILYWLTFQYTGIKNHDLHAYAEMRVRERFGGWHGVFKQYFGKDHPIAILADEIYRPR